MKSKTTGKQDFTGQKLQNDGGGAGNSEITVNRTSQPVDQQSTCTVLQSGDAKVHTDASLTSGDGRKEESLVSQAKGYPTL